MAFAVNKVILLGNLGRDPELRYTQSGKAVVKFSLATSDRGRDGQDRTEWHNIVAWDKLAELANRLCSKGMKVYVEGRLQTREYTDKDGNRRRSTEVVAREMVFLTETRPGGRRDGPPHPADHGGGGGGGGGGWGGNNGGGGGGGGRPQQHQQQAPARSDDIPYSDDEDIPF